MLGRIKRDYRPLDKDNLKLEGYDRLPRQRAGTKTAEAASSNKFKDTRGVFTEEQIKKETERCLGCGATLTDEYICVGCGQCVTRCKFDAISLVRKYDKAAVELKNLRPSVIKHALTRKLKITVKKGNTAKVTVSRGKNSCGYSPMARRPARVGCPSRTTRRRLSAASSPWAKVRGRLWR